ncbi:carbohydrate ABC transporter substrate-binding protein, CUT1 family [Paenibacillus sp. cl141a]|uniref:ABC transporter substrate-binding protein n=1 Tax=Paenibacillus sp. cl141a TaxID=1761877 RepID=UPI0008B0C0B0|nr:sugar ABC transporter substrate-binding protein [Paenibacillus sp. cl141a]SEK52598.1 carbohydrate ABC transporter substrate-binding protein, CUT1 family [Paenibacillus sp. cl141a]
MKTKSKFAGMVMLLLVFALSACSGGSNGTNGGTASSNPDASKPSQEASTGSDQKEPVTIEFMGHGNPNEKKIFEKLIASFEEKYPHVTVKYTSVPPGEYSQKMTTLISSGKVPDVFYVGGPEFYRFAEAGTLLNIQSYLDQTSLFNPDNVWKQAMDRYRFDGSKVGEGDLYGLPKDVGPWAFVYNKDLFDNAGVSYPSAKAGEWTWDDMLEAAQKLTVDNNGDGKPEQYGVGAYSLESAVWGNGGEYIDYATGTVKVNEPAFYEAMQFVADLNLKFKVSPNQEAEQAMNAYTRFINGQLGMFAMGPWDQPAFWELPFEWDIAAWPASPNTGQTATWLGSMGFAVSAKSKHPQEAFDLAAFLSLDEQGQRENYQLGQAVPNLINMAEGEFKEMDKGPQTRQVFLDIIQDYGRPNVIAFSKDTQWMDTFNQNASKVWNGEMSAKDFTAQIQPKMQELYDKGNK